MKRVSVVLADEQALLREGIAALIARFPRFEILGSTGDGRECVRLALRGQPDLIVFDCSMHGLSGLEAVRRIALRCPATRLVCLSAYEDSRWIRAAFDAGAHAYVVKRGAFAELMDAIETVLRSRFYVSPGIAHALVEARRPGQPPMLGQGMALSAREREVTQLFAEGYSAREIAERLHVSIKTVGTHREHIMAKLGIHGIAQLTRYALREGLTTLDA